MRKYSFCDADESERNPLIKGIQDASICCNYILSAYEILFGDVAPSEAKKTVEEDATNC